MTSFNKRRFEAAANYRTLSDWLAHSIDIFEEELRMDLPVLRTRSREASINDVYARRYFKVLRQNVVGSEGIKLKMGIRNANGNPDTLANMLIEERWQKFSKNITVDGMNLRETLGLFLETVARDGEVFAIIKRGKTFGPHMLQLQLLDAEYLDLDFNAVLDNGNRIANGIEYDKLHRRVAYHFWENYPDKKTFDKSNNKRLRVKAEDVIHGYEKERSSQGRGYPWLSSSLIQLAHVKEYKKSELIAARVASAKMGFFTRPANENDLGDYDDSYDPNAVIQEAEAGVFDVLPEGYGLQTFDPQNPNGNFSDFVKNILRGVAASVGVSYHTLANDAESTSYSSLRQFEIDERDTWREHQAWLIDSFLTPLFEAWLTMLLAMRLDNIRLPMDGFDKFNAPIWRPRTWQWIDPAKETAAIQLQLDQKIRSRSDVARSLGHEYKDVVDEIALENAYAESIGVDLGSSEGSREFARKLIERSAEDSEKTDDNHTKNNKTDK